MTYYRGQTINIQQLFINGRGEAGTITGTPTVSIYYWTGSALTTVVNAQDMTQMTGNLYVYAHTIANDASYGEYIAIFSATVDGVAGTGTEPFQVERYIKEAFLKKDATYSAGAITKVTHTYSRDGHNTNLESVDEDFAFTGDDVDTITGGDT